MGVSIHIEFITIGGPFFPTPLRLFWCPAHQYEDFPVDQFIEQLAEAKGTTVQDIVLNRIADNVAKGYIADEASRLWIKLTRLKEVVYARQLWPAKVNRAYNRIVTQFPPVNTIEHIPAP